MVSDQELWKGYHGKAMKSIGSWMQRSKTLRHGGGEGREIKGPPPGPWMSARNAHDWQRAVQIKEARQFWHLLRGYNMGIKTICGYKKQYSGASRGCHGDRR